MATRKKKTTEVEVVWPKVTVGSHSTRTEYQDGRVEFVSDWDALHRDVQNAIASVQPELKKKSKKTALAK